MYDVIVIGAGPAGISAALYAKRAGKNVLVLYYGESNLEKTSVIQNYYGFEDGISAKKLYADGIKQAQNIGIDVIKDEVVNIEKNENEFCVLSVDNKYLSKTLIISTGNKKNKPNIENLSNYEGKGVSYCATCDGFFYRNKNVAVIGSGNYAITEAKYLKNIVESVTILTDGEEVQIDDFETNTKKLRKIYGENAVEGVEFEDGTKLHFDGFFIALGEAGAFDFSKQMGIFTKGENIIVNEEMETNIEGLYACGDVTGGLLQICKAVYEGAKAGINSTKYLNEKGEN